MSRILFKNVTHIYGNVNALDNINCEFEERKITSVIGKSGSGKSTLLQLINGLQKPSAGTVSVFGSPLNYGKITKTRLKIGYSVQGTGLFPHMNIYDNISLLGKITGQKKHVTELRVDTLMSLVNLPPVFKTKYPYQLSGGEQQRVGICRAMLLNPPVFLLDEAFGALDPETKNEIHAELLNLQNVEPRTIVLVTHDHDEAKKLSDYAVILDKGKIINRGKSGDIL